MFKGVKIAVEWLVESKIVSYLLDSASFQEDESLENILQVLSSCTGALISQVSMCYCNQHDIT